MNISSLVITIKDGYLQSVIDRIKGLDFCQIHHNQKNKIIVTIEGNDSHEEMEQINDIQGIEGVLNANVAFSYCEDELNLDRDKLDKSDPYPNWLNDQSMPAQSIAYGGHIKR